MVLEERRLSRWQNATHNRDGAARALPYAFTRQGVALQLGLPRSPWAVSGDIEIERAFVRPRQIPVDSAGRLLPVPRSGVCLLDLGVDLQHQPLKLL
jgi:hypothetical protein